MDKGSVFTCFLIIGMSTIGWSQATEVKSSNSKFHYSVFTGLGRSYFKSSIASPSKFPTPEIRIGASLILLLNDHFDIGVRPALGLEVKVEKKNIPGQPYVYSGPFIEMDDMVSRNHYFCEIPFLVQYRLNHPRLNIGIGIYYRQFFNQSDYESLFDPLNGRREFGILARLGYRINERIQVGVEHSIGLTKVYSSAGNIDGEDFQMTVKNRYTQLTIEYRLRFKKD